MSERAVLRLIKIPERVHLLVVGLSGGPDSLSLLDVLRHEEGLQLIVAHFNHHLRENSDQEAELLKNRMREWDLQFFQDEADVADYAHREGFSIEEAGRKLRYKFLFRVARENQADGVAVGHNADDQVETILMHFLRGTGINGLIGMRSESRLSEFDPEIPLFRPLLRVWRHEIEKYCNENGLKPILDPSNQDPIFQRNRLRLALIPELEKQCPQIKQTILRTAEAVRGDWEIVSVATDQAWKDAHAQLGNGWISFSSDGLKRMPQGIVTNLVRRAGAILLPDARDFGYRAAARAAEFLRDHEVTGRCDFENGLFLIGEGKTCFIATRDADLPSLQWPQVESEIIIADAEIQLKNGWVLSIEHKKINEEARSDDAGLCSLDADQELVLDPWTAWLAHEHIHKALTIRRQAPGDRIAPFGLHGKSVKLQDLFINQKIPRRARAKWPIVCSGDEIVWVPGIRSSHNYRVTERTARVICLRLKKEKGLV